MKRAVQPRTVRTLPVPAIHHAVLRWYRRRRRPLPWRTTHDPYRILLSEIMLQQTQADRVIAFYHRWIKKFPSFRSLAMASVSDVLKAWSGLGYNSRALRFHRLAAIVVSEFGSTLPSDPAVLRTLPGIGRYTAHAVACFSFGQRVPVVDINIRRILTRLTRSVRDSGALMAEHDAWIAAEQLLPRRTSYDWNQALMDLGALVCTARKPLCAECPLSAVCQSAGAPALRRPPKHAKTIEPMHRGIPRRLYRGKILKMLHERRHTVDSIASMLWRSHTASDRKWLAGVISSMCREGLLRKSRSAYTIA